jgi:hypothetical protein
LLCPLLLKATSSKKQLSIDVLRENAKMSTVQEHAATHDSIYTVTRADMSELTRDYKWALDGLAVLGVYKMLVVTT